MREAKRSNATSEVIIINFHIQHQDQHCSQFSVLF